MALAAPSLSTVASFLREYCQRVLRRGPQDCAAYAQAFDTAVFIVESSRRRVAVEVQLENRGENAYSAVLNISQSANLRLASLVQKVQLGGAWGRSLGEEAAGGGWGGGWGGDWGGGWGGGWGRGWGGGWGGG